MFSVSYCTKIRELLIHSCLIFANRGTIPGAGMADRSRRRLVRELPGLTGVALLRYWRQISGREKGVRERADQGAGKGGKERADQGAGKGAERTVDLRAEKRGEECAEFERGKGAAGTIKYLCSRWRGSLVRCLHKGPARTWTGEEKIYLST